MIKYGLTCEDGHSFDSWFSSGEDFARLEGAGLLSCAVCGSSKVKKALMTPQVGPKGKEKPAGPLSRPASPAEQAVRALREKVEKEGEDVGRNFATEARAIHTGDAPERPIYGEAKLEDAKSLIEDGIPVAPLPWQNRTRN